MNMKAYILSDNFIILHLIEYLKMIPLAKLKSGCVGLFYFLLRLCSCHERSGIADILVF